MGGPTSAGGPPPDQNPWAVPSGQQPPPAYGPPPVYGPPTYGPPAYWPVPPPTPRPRRRWLPWVILASVLTVGGCGALVATIGMRAYHDLDHARATANEFLSAVERGDASRAQDLLCDEAPPDTVTSAMQVGIVSHRITGVSMHSGFGSHPYARKTANVTVELTVDGGSREQEVVAVTFEHEVWLVCGLGRFGAG